MNPKKALSKFLTALGTAPEGAQFEVGLTWDQRKGWRVYQRVGSHVLMLGPDDARRMAALYERTAARPEWRGRTHGLERTLGELRPLADEAEQKNRERVIPDHAAEFLPAAGSA